MTIKDSFNDLSESEFKTYADSLLGNTRTAERRKEYISYLADVNSKDKAALDVLRLDAYTKMRTLVKREKIIQSMSRDHEFDFSKTSYLFSTDTLDDSELESLITQANKTIYVHGKSYTGNLTFGAANVTLDGSGNQKSARGDELINTAQFTGGITISANGIKLKGIDFTSPVEKAIQFTSGANNVTLQNCKFIATPSVSDSKFWWGENYGQGNITIKNCRVEGFKGVHLFDANTTSAVPTTPLNHVKIQECYFKNNLGSLATRGMDATPNKSVEYSNNKFETTVLHASFWDFVEINNSKKSIVKDNVFIAPVGTESETGKKGVFQTWSKSDKPWNIIYSGNTISNIKFGIKIPLVNGFYAPDTTGDHFVIDLTSSHTNVTYAMSVLYKSNSGSTASHLKYHPGLTPPNDYTPVNAVAYPSIPTINTNNLTIVQ